MSTLAVETPQGILGDDQIAEPIKRRLRQARDHKRGMEPTWHSNMAFGAGKHFLEWDRFSRTLRLPDDLVGKELYSADVITEYREHVLGELGSDDDRPELLLRRDDKPSEDYQETLNKAVGWGWDNEWDGDDALTEARQLCVDLGTSAVRCRFDPTVGPPIGEQPYLDGEPVTRPQDQYDLFGEGPRADVQMKQVRQGKIRWEPLSAFNLLVPPGIPREKYFPWEGIVRPALLSSVKAEYGAVAAELKEDGDIGSLLGYSTEGAGTAASGGGTQGRLRDHIWLFLYFERPNAQWPNGRVVHLAGNRMVPIRHENKLPYIGPDGEYRSGISYMHFWRVTGRFWSRGLIEPMKDIQRGINKRRTQTNEIIDRGMPFLIVQKDSKALGRKGTPMELVEIEATERPPMPVNGLPAGTLQSIQADVEAHREDLEHATGVRAPRLGENPAGVNTYAQLALINENDQTKRQRIVNQHRAALKELVEDSVYDMRRYWGPQRTLMLAGDEDEAETHVFNATQIPPFFIVKVPTGAAKPRGQAASLKLIEDVGQYSLNARAPVPVSWLKASLEAGQALEIPEEAADDQADKAHLENHMLLMGQDVPVSYYDPPATHVPIHRSAQIQAELAGDVAAWQRIETHVQAHLLAAQEAAQQVAQAASPPPFPSPPPGAAPPPQPGQPSQPMPPQGAGPGVPPQGAS